MLLSLIGVFCSQYIIVLTTDYLVGVRQNLLNKVISSFAITILFFSQSTGMVFFQNHIFLLSLGIILSTYLVIFISLKAWKKIGFYHLLISFLTSYLIYYLADFVISVISISFLSIEYLQLALVVSTLLASCIQIPCYYMLKQRHVDRFFKQIEQYKRMNLLLIVIITLNIFVISYVTLIIFPAVISAVEVRNMAVLRETTIVVMLILLVDALISGAVIWFCSYLYSNSRRMTEQEMQLLQQNLYIQKLETIQQNLRMVQHDYKNVLSGIYLQAENGDMNGIQEFMKKTFCSFDTQIDNNIKLTSQLANMKIIEIKSLLLLKLMEMERQNVSCTFEVPKEVSFVSMSVIDFNRCLGILIDNAIEEVLKQEVRKITVVINNELDQLIVIVKNPVRKQPILAKIWEEGYSTKGENRGLGLTIYVNLISKYQNILKQTICSETEFSQIFTIMQNV